MRTGNRSAWAALCSIALLTACSGGGSSGTFPTGTSTSRVLGTIVNELRLPMAGALVELDSESANHPVQTKTSAKGQFELIGAVGENRLTIATEGLLIYAKQLKIAPNTLDLGEIVVNSKAEDIDADGLADSLESSGWTILVNELGGDEFVKRKVFSDATLEDSDGDGLSDLEEFSAKTDPRLADTDGDLVDDRSEIVVYRSLPAHVDSDCDARGPECDKAPNPSLFDGQELQYSRTSPTLADTDGDGLTDYEEILGGGFNPLVADLPIVDLELNGDPSVALNATYEGSTEIVTAESTLERNESSNSRTDTQSTRTTIENSQEISIEGKKSFPGGVSVKAKAKAKFKQSMMNESSSSWTEESVQETQDTFEQTFGSKENVKYEDGEVQVAIKVRNSSNLSVKIKDIKVIAYRLNAHTSGAFPVVGTLAPGTTGGTKDLPPEGIVLGPGGDFTFVAQNDDVNYQNILPLMKNPTGLFFEVGSYSLFQTDDFGNETRNFAVLGQHIVERCGLLVVDFGDGRIERYMVAANVRRNPNGSGAGIRLRDVLQNILHIPYETHMDSEGRESLRGVRGQRSRKGFPNPESRSIWLVAGSGPQFDEGVNKSFNDLVLRAGETINLVYLTDTDDDGLSDREEDIYGTSSLTTDTDLDGISDFDETKVGWEITFSENGEPLPQYTYQVYCDPRFADADREGLTDPEELAKGTDPNKDDTDDDGILDLTDEHVDPPDSQGLPTVGLVGHWRCNGDGEDATVLEHHAVVNHKIDEIHNGQSRPGVFDFFDRRSQIGALYFDDGPGPGPVPYGEMVAPHLPISESFTIAAWVQDEHDGYGWIAGQRNWAHLELEFAGETSNVTFIVPTSTGEARLRSAGEHRSGQWHFYAITAHWDGLRTTLTIYQDGQIANDPLVLDERLVNPQKNANVRDFAVGTELQGAVDDVRVYRLALMPQQIEALYHEFGYGK